MWSFRFGLLFIHDSSSIKVAPLLYYTSVLISTKITTVFSLRDPYCNPTERFYEIEGPRLSAGITHKLKPSPSTWPESWNVCIPLRSTSYVPGSTSDSYVDQFLTLTCCRSVKGIDGRNTVKGGWKSLLDHMAKHCSPYRGWSILWARQESQVAQQLPQQSDRRCQNGRE